MFGPQVRLECKLLHPDARLPTRSRTTDAGYDLSSIEEAVVPPHDTVKIDTGIAVSAPAGYYYTIDGRSSLWMKRVIPFRGIIDGTYTGPLIVILSNHSDDEYKINKGDRIAQMVLHRINHCDVVQVNEFSPYYNQRGQNGFGSTGRA
jgi:dUTP pyrophosphatase